MCLVKNHPTGLFYVFLLCVYGIFDPPDPGTRKIYDFHQKSVENRPILAEIGFQKLRIGRGSVLTKYEPVASRVDPVLKLFC